MSLLKQGGSSKVESSSPAPAPIKQLDPLRGIAEVPSAPAQIEEPVENIQKAHDAFDDIVSNPIQKEEEH